MKRLKMTAFSIRFPWIIIGLALAVSIAAYVNSGLLFWYLRREKVFEPQPGWAPYIAKVLLASAVMGGLLFTFGGDAELWVDAGLIERITRLFVLVVAGIASFFIVVLITRIPVKEMLTDKRLRDV